MEGQTVEVEEVEEVDEVDEVAAADGDEEASCLPGLVGDDASPAAGAAAAPACVPVPAAAICEGAIA